MVNGFTLRVQAFPTFRYNYFKINISSGLAIFQFNQVQKSTEMMMKSENKNDV